MTTRLTRRDDGFASAPRATHFDAVFRARLRDLLLWRRDVRRFRPDPLPAGMLESLIELACLAPSDGLSQVSSSSKIPSNGGASGKTLRRRMPKPSRPTTVTGPPATPR